MDTTRVTTTQQQAIATLLTVHEPISGAKKAAGGPKGVTSECHIVSRADRRTAEVSISQMMKER